MGGRNRTAKKNCLHLKKVTNGRTDGRRDGRTKALIEYSCVSATKKRDQIGKRRNGLMDKKKYSMIYNEKKPRKKPTIARTGEMKKK